MGVRVEGIEDFSAFVVEIETNVRRGVGKALYGKAQQLQKLARAMAPVEYGGIEESIKINGDGKQERRGDGTFGGIQVEVYIDDTMPAPHRPGVTIDQYVYEVHEHMEPVGTMRRGDLSNQKMASTGIEVGGGFMYRAGDAIDSQLDKETDKMLDGTPDL